MATALPARVSRGIQTWIRKNPLDNLREEMEQLINQFSTDFDGVTGETRLPFADLSETDKAFEVKVDVPGFKPDEIQVEMRGETLQITGEHKEEKEEKGKMYHRVERRSGSIRRSVFLPSAVDAEGIAAQCRDGVLTVTLPKCEASQTKKIPVKA